MNDCREIRGDLSALVDGQLPPVRRADVEAHLADCARCQGQVAQLRQLAAGIAALPRMSPPSDFLSEVRRKIRGDEPARNLLTWSDILFRPVWLKVPLEAMVVVVVLGALLALLRPLERKTKAIQEAEFAWDPSAIVMPGQKTDENVLNLGNSAEVLLFSGNPTVDRRSEDLPHRAMETLIVTSDSFTEVKTQAEETAAPLRGRLVVPAEGAVAQSFFVELPAAHVAVFKEQFAAVRQQAAQKDRAALWVDDLSGAKEAQEPARDYADVDSFTGVQKKKTAESLRSSAALSVAVPVDSLAEKQGPMLLLEIQVVSPVSTER